MVTENPTWGAPRIHGELLMLGFDISERTISRWMKRAPRGPEPAKRWLSSKSPGSHRGDGLLYRSDHCLRCALLLPPAAIPPSAKIPPATDPVRSWFLES